MNHERVQLKRATELLVRSVGGIEAAASILNRGHATVGRWVNRNDEDHFINIADLAELEANAPAPVVTAALARLTGSTLSPLTCNASAADALPMMFMNVVKEFGEFADRLRAGFEDGHFDRSDANRALPELDDVDGCLAEFRKVLGQIAAAEPAKLRAA